MPNLKINAGLNHELLNLMSKPTSIENPEERRRRFVMNVSLFLLLLITISCPFTTIPLIISGSISGLIVSLVMVLTAGICGVAWRAAKAGKVNQAAWLLLVIIMAVNTLLFLIIYHGILSVVSYLMIAIMALIILGVKAAYATIACGSALTIFAWATNNLVTLDSRTQLTMSFNFDTTILLVLVMVGTVWLATYLANNLNHANALVNQQTEQLGMALANIEKKRAIGENVSNRVFSLTAELNATANQQSTGSRQQASALTQVTSFVQEMTNTAQSIANKANDLSRMALQIKDSTGRVKTTSSEVKEAGEKGASTVERAINSSQQVSDLYTDLKNILTDMEQQQGRIKEVVSLIKSISDETHLLSLNAAIEAAGAGEYGERFGVVATEVKALADRSNLASREVSEILSQVESRIEQAVSAADISHKETKKALEAAQESGIVMDALVGSIYRNSQEIEQIEQVADTVSNQVTEINHATSQQYNASSQALETLQGIGVVASQNASGSAEITKSSQILETLSQDLLETLSI
jgi:methyl-accepting chemotaxis protein